MSLNEVHPDYGEITTLFTNESLSSPVYLTITHVHLVAGNLPIKTFVARQQQINIIMYGYLQTLVDDGYLNTRNAVHRFVYKSLTPIC